jgi:superfamily II DNA or RNA helicase
MADITVKKLDEVYLKIDCEPSLAKELSLFFTFKVPGAEFSPQYRKRYWDGLIRLFNIRTGKIYVGLLPYLKAFAKERGYTMAYDNAIEATNEFSLHEAQEYVKSLKIQSKGQPLEARDYQIASFVYGIRDKRMLLLSPTSSGKSYIQYVLFRYLTEVKGCKKGLLIVPTINLVDQMYTDFMDYSSKNKFDVKANCHEIFQGRDKQTDKKLTISTWQSIYELPAEYFEQFDFILGDEAHLFRADSLTSIMTKANKASYRIGMTGTLDGSKIHKLVLEGLFGKTRTLITTKELQDRGQVASLTIKCLFLTYPEEASEHVLDSTYMDELDYILAHKGRNKFIKNLALSLKGNTLLLFQYVDKHGVILHDMIKKSVDPNRPIFFVSGKTEAEEREMIRQVVNESNDAILIASYGTFSTGVNIPHLHNIILTSPTKSRIRVLQSIGRGLRLGEFKNHCTLFDIIDDFSIGAATNTTLDHFQERFSYYVGEKFDYKFYNIKITGEA